MAQDFLRTVAATLLAAAIAPASRAAEPDAPVPQPPYSRYEFDIGSPASIDTPAQLNEALGMLDRRIVTECSADDRALELEVSRLDAFTAHVRRIEPMDFPLTIYKVTGIATGCGVAPRRHNISLADFGDTAAFPSISVGIPGETRSLPYHQQDYGQQIVVAAAMLNPNCPFEELRNMRFVDSRVVGDATTAEYLERRGPDGPPPGATLVEAWEETWTLSACGYEDEISVMFGADDQGGLGIALQLSPEAVAAGAER